MFSLRGRFNYLNISRFGNFCERTYRWHFERTFDFSGFNFVLLKGLLKPDQCIAAVDCCFSSKSGKRTWGLDKFWSSILCKAAKGIEISCIAIINLAKAEIIEANNGKPVETFSIMALKRAYENTANLHQFIKIFELKPERILNHPNYCKMISQWKMAA